MGERIDVLLIIGPVIFVLEFKTGAQDFPAYAVDQVTDYALDLKNFHETSHDRIIAPILIATGAKAVMPLIAMTPQNDKLLTPIRANAELLGQTIKDVLRVRGRGADRLADLEDRTIQPDADHHGGRAGPLSESFRGRDLAKRCGRDQFARDVGCGLGHHPEV